MSNRLPAVLVLFLAAYVPAWAERPTTELRIEVNNGSGKPVERASVIMDFLTAHRQVFKLGRREAKHWEVRTNMEGVAHFPSIPQGKVRLQVIAKNYQTFGEEVDLDDAQQTVKLTLLPPQKQYSIYGTSGEKGNAPAQGEPVKPTPPPQ